MAKLSNDQIRNILAKTARPEELKSCNDHDIRARFHIEPSLNKSRLPYLGLFLEWVGNIINKDKKKVFEMLLTLPIETVDFTEGVFDELTKVFDAQDRHIGYQFTNPELSSDFSKYREQIGDSTFWQTRGFHAMKTAINSIVIVDLPAEQVTRFPEPYYYLLDVQRVISCHVSKGFKFEYIIFYNAHTDEILHAYDDEFYRTYARRKDDTWELITERPHDLNYTPARSFWTTPFTEKSKLQKRGPQSNALGKFDWLLLLYTFTKHVELYAGFPIDVVYEQACSYKDAQGNSCEGGKIRKTVSGGPGHDPAVSWEDCPSCANKNILGPGTLLTAPGMASKDDPDLLAGMNRISADTESLDYLLKRIDSYEVGISTNMIGYVAEGIREAMNKEQVGSMLESQINCLAEIRDNFENIHKFVLDSLARLRYGPGAVLGVTVNYGRKWFIHSVEKLQTQFAEAKANGFANFELTSQFNQILTTKYKNNPTMLERVRTLAAIEPYQNYNTSDLLSLIEKVKPKKEMIQLKVDFGSYVARFEREYMDIGTFMQFAPFEVKVAFIQDKLLEYVGEDYPEETPPEPPVPPIPPIPPAPPIPDPGPTE